MRYWLSLLACLFASSVEAQTSIQWGKTGTAPSNWSVGVIDNAQTFQPYFTQPPTGGGQKLLNALVPNPTVSALGGIEALSSATSHEWLQYVDTSGVQHLLQPGISDLSGLGTNVAAALSNPTNSINGILTNPINIAATGNWYQNQGASVQRLNDRSLFSGATQNDGNSPLTNLDWLSAAQFAQYGIPGTINFADVGVLTANNSSAASGAIALIVGAQSLFSTAFGTETAGINSFAYNNNTTLPTNAWGYYGECHNQTSAVNQCLVFEGDVFTTFAGVTPTPDQQGISIVLQVGCGNTPPFSSETCDVGEQFIGNTEPFKVGINFINGAVLQSAGAGHAINFAKGDGMYWYNSAGTTALASINSTQDDIVTISANVMQMFGNATSLIDLGLQGFGPPTFTTTSAGEKIAYATTLSGSAADYAVGVASGVLWNGIPDNTSGNEFDWYGGTTLRASLTGAGVFTLTALSGSGTVVACLNSSGAVVRGTTGVSC